MDKLNFYTVDSDYVEFLKKEEIKHRGFSRIPDRKCGRDNKPQTLCGIVLRINNMHYYVPITSCKQQKPDNFLIKAANGQTTGSLRFNYMFPVPKELISQRTIASEPHRSYRALLAQELRYCIKNQEMILHAANRTYKRVLLGKDPGLVTNSCDFKLLEQACFSYRHSRPAPAPNPCAASHEFSRTQLLTGSDGLSRLKNSAVLVFGIGGVGSHCIEALARSGIGRLVIVDSDQVSITNINRQSIAAHSTIGRQKTAVMKEKILDINPSALVETYETFILPDNLDAFFADIPWEIDYIIDAIDTVSAKLAIAAYAYNRRIPLLSSMGTGNKLHPELFEIADIGETSVCPLCRVMRRELKRLGIPGLKVLYSREQPVKPALLCDEETGKRSIPASISFVPPVAGLLMAGEVIRFLAGID